MIEIFTDGACQGNPGRGGFATILRYKGHEKVISHGYRLTTNNRMELLAVISGLEALTLHTLPITVYSDSQYVINAIEKKWVFGWERKNFQNKANEDLWRRFLRIYRKVPHVKFIWVKGHAGHPENERCDQQAVWAASQPQLLTDTGYESQPSLS